MDWWRVGYVPEAVPSGMKIFFKLLSDQNLPRQEMGWGATMDSRLTTGQSSLQCYH